VSSALLGHGRVRVVIVTSLSPVHGLAVESAAGRFNVVVSARDAVVADQRRPTQGEHKINCFNAKLQVIKVSYYKESEICIGTSVQFFFHLKVEYNLVICHST
jgi:hypothetical protein